MARLRLVVALCRPPVVLTLALFGVLGMVQGGGARDELRAVPVLVAITAFVVFSIAVNDLADEAVDRANLGGGPVRPLAHGLATRRHVRTLAACAAAVVLVAGAAAGWRAVVVLGIGLAVSGLYSLQLSSRGAIASLALPALFVAVPYLVGLLSARTALHGQDLLLLGGLYLGFVGRIVLKDFRDVRGDELFGKRTFLVRHGRSATCAFSAVSWALGTACLLGVRGLTPTLVAVEAILVVVALVLLRALADDRGARHDEWTISALAIVGRAVVLCVVVHIAAVDSGWPALLVAAIVVVLAVAFLGQARAMYHDGPAPSLHVPAAWMQHVENPATRR